jgi:hypothetical protein
MDRKTRALFREIGRKGGKIAGKRSLETMTPEERSARQEGCHGRGQEADGRKAGEGARRQDHKK